MVSSRTKGNRNELRLAKLLSEWVGVEFHRTPMSGGLHWKKDNRIEGDIVAPVDFNFPFTVEAKCGQEMRYDFGKLLTEFDSQILKAWQQAQDQANATDKLPLLCFRYNGLPKGFFFVVMDIDNFLEIAGSERLRISMEMCHLGIAVTTLDELMEIPYNYVAKRFGGDTVSGKE